MKLESKFEQILRYWIALEERTQLEQREEILADYFKKPPKNKSKNPFNPD